MNKVVTTIAPTRPLRSLTDIKNDVNIIKRTAAYCRVSTDSEEQSNSFDNQVEEWTKRILENPQYQLVKIYADEGISGTSAKNRDGFNQMIEDAKAGKIDLILCKSISRFARNTVLTIQTIRELKAIGVEVYFDNERMSTFDEKTEFMLSIISSMAQEESRHISENVKWTFQKMMKEGKPIITTSRFLGYTKGEDGNLVIVPEEAEIIKLIYTMYDEGCGIYEIRRTLRKKGYKTVSEHDRPRRRHSTRRGYPRGAVTQRRRRYDRAEDQSPRQPGGKAVIQYPITTNRALFPRGSVIFRSVPSSDEEYPSTQGNRSTTEPPVIYFESPITADRLSSELFHTASLSVRDGASLSPNVSSPSVSISNVPVGYTGTDDAVPRLYFL